MAEAGSNIDSDDNSERTEESSVNISKDESSPALDSLGVFHSRQSEDPLGGAFENTGTGYGNDPARATPALQSLTTLPGSLEAQQTPFNTPIAQVPSAAPPLPSSLSAVSRQIQILEAATGPSIHKSHRAPYNGKDNVQDYAPEKLDDVLTAVKSTGQPEGPSLGTHGAAHLAGEEAGLSDPLPGADLTTPMDMDDIGDSETGELLKELLSPGLQKDFEAFEGTRGPAQSTERASQHSIPRKPVADVRKISSDVTKDPETSSSAQARRSSSPRYSPGTPIIWAADFPEIGQQARMSLDSGPDISSEKTGHSRGRIPEEESQPLSLPKVDDDDDAESVLSTAVQIEGEGARASHLWQPSDFTSQDHSAPIVFNESEDLVEDTDDPNGEAHNFVHPIERESGDGLGAHRILKGADHPARVGSNQPIPREPLASEVHLKQLAAKSKLEEKMKLSGHALDPEIAKTLKTKEHPAINTFRQYASVRHDLESVRLGLAAMNEALEDGHHVTAEKLAAEHTIATLRVAAQKSVDIIRKLSAEKRARQKADKDDPDFKDRDKEIAMLRRQIEEKDDFLQRNNAHWVFQVRQLERKLRDAEKTEDALERCLENNRDKEERIEKLQNAVAGGGSVNKGDQKGDVSNRQGDDDQPQGACENQAAGLEAERIVLESIVLGIQSNSKGYSHSVLKTDGSLVTQLKSIENYVDMTLQQFHSANKEISDAKEAIHTINANLGFGRLLNVPTGQVHSVTNFRYKYHTLSEIIEELILRIREMSSMTSEEERPLGHEIEGELTTMPDDKERRSLGLQPAMGGPSSTNLAKSGATKDLEEELEATKEKLAMVKKTWEGIEPEVYHELEDMLKQEKKNVHKLEKLAEAHRKDATRLRGEVKNLDKQVKLGEDIHQLDKAQLEKEITGLKKLLEKLRAEKAATRDRRDSGFQAADRRPYKATQLAVDFALIRCDAALRAMANKRLVYGFEYGDAEEAIEAALLAITLSEQCQDEALTSRSNFWAGVAHYYSDDLGNALHHFKNAQKGKRWVLPAGEYRMLDLWVVRGANLPVPKDAVNYGGKRGSRRQSSMDSRDGNMGSRKGKGLVKHRPGSSGSMD